MQSGRLAEVQMCAAYAIVRQAQCRLPQHRQGRIRAQCRLPAALGGDLLVTTILRLIFIDRTGQHELST